MADYTINDAFCDGFECGIEYLIRYDLEILGHVFSSDDIEALAWHLAEKKRWKSADEWERMLYSARELGGK